MLLRIDNNPREHDFTEPRWGHALHSPQMVTVDLPPKNLWQRISGTGDKIQILQALGHGNVRQGDTILVKMQSGRTARFIVREIFYYSDLDDMFKLERADFVSYMDESVTQTPKHPL